MTPGLPYTYKVDGHAGQSERAEGQRRRRRAGTGPHAADTACSGDARDHGTGGGTGDDAIHRRPALRPRMPPPREPPP